MSDVLKPAPKKGAKKTKKHRKHGRNTKYCEMYRATGRREANKARKAARHAKRMSK